MKTSLKKLRGFALHKHASCGGDEQRDRRDLRSFAHLDDLAQASQDMQDMRDCYDSLLSAAAATANSAYEFSESLHEMGSCLLERTALNDDEENGRALLMLGKEQFELQKLVDVYRSHIFQTITIPSESLLNELQIVEEMKQHCDEKRDVYEHMLQTHREKGRGRHGKGHDFSVQQLQAVQEEYDQEATVVSFRLKSLKQGQSCSLLTQAARHHAAQLSFFRKAVKALEAIEPHVRSVTEKQYIDYQFLGLEDDEGDDGEDNNDDETNDDGELSFDYGQSDKDKDVSTSRNMMEMDHVDVSLPQGKTSKPAKDNLEGIYRKSFSFRRETRDFSKSAPLSFHDKSNPSARMKQMRLSSKQQSNTYVLPTPVDSKVSNSVGSGGQNPNTFKTSLSGHITPNLWYSSPLGRKNMEEPLGSKNNRGESATSAQSVLRESNRRSSSTPRVHLPSADRLLLSPLDLLSASDPKKSKRLAFSGPIARNPLSTRPFSVEHPQLYSGPIMRSSLAPVSTFSQKLSPKVSPTASPVSSSPKISELHELPQPPATAVSKSKPLTICHSGPLMIVAKGQGLPTNDKSLASNTASPLPTPSQAIARSFSIPSGGGRSISSDVSRPQETNEAMDDESPPLTPISLSHYQRSPT